MSYSQRLNAVRTKIIDHNALLISDPVDIFYLTGFICLTPEEREAFLLLTPTSSTLFLTAFSSPPVVEGLTVMVGSLDRLLKEHLPQIYQHESLSTLQIDGNSLRFNEYQFLSTLLTTNVEIQSLKEAPLHNQRMIKDADEIELLGQANHITHQALTYTIQHLKIGMTELEVQEVFEHEVRKFGTKQFAFPTIVAFGPHSALPHHQPGDTKLSHNQPVLIDCGAKWHGYCADVTRTIWFGDKPDSEFIKIESIVHTAYEKTVAYLKNKDLTALQIDKVCRDYISEQGYGPQFIHTTGHGVGLYIHESPSLNLRNDTGIKPNMVITVEPGIYLPDRFGYRFENSILVTQDGYQELL